MSLFPTEAVKVTAEASGYPAISDDVAQAIASDLEYTLRELTQEAAKFVRQSKRRKMRTGDVNSALRARNLEPLYGYSGGSSARTVEKLFRRAKNSDIFYMPDDTVNLKTILSKGLPEKPAGMRFTKHWLAVDGVQPNTPQNPGMVEASAAATVTAAANAGPAAGSAAARAEQAKAAEMQSMQTMHSNVLAPENMASGGSDVVAPIMPLPVRQTRTLAEAQAQALDDTAVTTVDEGVRVKGLVKHVLSREQQLLFKQIREALLGDAQELRSSALESLAQDPGQHQLVPFFVEFANDQVTHHLKDIKVLSGVVALIGALNENPNVILELYLHQLMPPLLTCVVGKRLGREGNDAHWTLRRESAQVVAGLCRQHSARYAELQSRVLKTMLSSLLDKTKPLSTHYGASVCFAAFGPRVVDKFLVVNLPPYFKIWESKRHTEPEAAEHVKDALQACVVEALKMRKADVDEDTASLPTFDEAEMKRYHDLVPYFGDALSTVLAGK